MITSMTWLRFWSAAVAGTGFLVVVTLAAGVDWPLQLFTDLAFWPLDGSPRAMAPETKFFAAIVGGLTAGLCVMAGLVLDRALRAGDIHLARIATTGFVTWFVVDSLGSLAVGAWMNVVLNAVILLGFLVPVALWKPAH